MDLESTDPDMETVQIKIETCPDNSFGHPRSHPMRKVSFDHGRHANIADLNGNYGHRMLNRRRGSCETSSLLSSLSVRKNSIPNLDSLSDIPDWQKSLVQQIENLAVNVSHGESIKTEIENELGTINEGVVPRKRPSQRRKSFMHNGHFLHPHRQISHGSVTGHAPHPLSNITNANIGRRKSYANIEHHIARTRRSGSVGNLKDTLPPRGRRSSVCHHGAFHNPPLRQRRKSCVKAPTFTISKITSVQKKSYWIYRRRRRKELRHVEQITAPKITINSDDGSNESHSRESDNENNEISENSVAKANDAIDGDIDSQNGDVNLNGSTPNTEDDTVDSNLSVEEAVPVVRRKCSIQMRYFEISRKRRKDRRKVGSGNLDSETKSESHFVQDEKLADQCDSSFDTGV